MKRTMYGFVGSLTIFIAWMALSSAMLVVPAVLTTNENDEAPDPASRSGTSQATAGDLTNGAPPQNPPQPVDRQMEQAAARK